MPRESVLAEYRARKNGSSTTANSAATVNGSGMKENVIPASATKTGKPATDKDGIVAAHERSFGEPRPLSHNTPNKLNALRNKVSNLRRESSFGAHQSDGHGHGSRSKRSSDRQQAIKLPDSTKLNAALSSFDDEDFVTQCEKAMTTRARPSRSHPEKEKQDLSELVKTLRACMQQMFSKKDLLVSECKKYEENIKEASKSIGKTDMSQKGSSGGAMNANHDVLEDMKKKLMEKEQSLNLRMSKVEKAEKVLQESDAKLQAQREKVQKE